MIFSVWTAYIWRRSEKKPSHTLFLFLKFITASNSFRVSVFGCVIGDLRSDSVTKESHLLWHRSKPYKGRTLENDRLEVRGSGDWHDELIAPFSRLLLFCMNNHGNYFLRDAQSPFYLHNRWEKESESSVAVYKEWPQKYRNLNWTFSKYVNIDCGNCLKDRAAAALKCLAASKMPWVSAYLQSWVEEKRKISTMCLLLKNLFCKGGNSARGGFGGGQKKVGWERHVD